ncbi:MULTISPECIES: hypothetical protein [Paenibacillus]|uniref:hypothetical protein n=1 Tax=Paenibacillus TaxID=44249 RepID=UPI00119F8538|nr:hypothetical protein [Paenibacillus sp. IHBB 10380]
MIQQTPPAPPAYVYLPTGSTAISNPMDMYGYSKCRVYVKPAVPGISIDVTVKGAPNEYGPYAEELGPAAKQTGISGEVSYMLEQISRFLRIEVANFSGSWTIWVVPLQL